MIETFQEEVQCTLAQIAVINEDTVNHKAAQLTCFHKPTTAATLQWILLKHQLLVLNFVQEV